MSQLRLEKNDLQNVPVIPLPEGYCLRTYQPGDEAGIGRIYQASALGEGTVEQVRSQILDHPCFRPDRLFVVQHAHDLVATAAAWIERPGADYGYLHMVGSLPEHRGKRLGAIVTLAAIRHTCQEGFTRQQLCTDDWREYALRLYLDLGYYPLYCDETHPSRWAAIAETLGRPHLLVRAKRLGE